HAARQPPQPLPPPRYKLQRIQRQLPSHQPLMRKEPVVSSVRHVVAPFTLPKERRHDAPRAEPGLPHRLPGAVPARATTPPPTVHCPQCATPPPPSRISASPPRASCRIPAR